MTWTTTPTKLPVWQVTDKQPLELRGQAVLVIGCGALGSALASAFQALGAELALWSRRSEQALSLARAIGARAGADLAVELARARLVCIAISDDALQGFVESLGQGPQGRGFVFHTNGSLGYEVLVPLARLGWQTGRLHPLRAFPQAPAEEPRPVAGTWFASDSGEAERGLCSALVRALGGQELRLKPAASLALHSSASLLSGGLVALFDQALELAAGACEQPAAARGALLDLLGSTLSNLEERSPGEALSGPIARGASRLVEAQLETLDGEARELYRLLGRRMLDLSCGRQPMDPESLRRLRELLG